MSNESESPVVSAPALPAVSMAEFRVFAYLNSEKAALYRAVMLTFLHAKTRFALHMRPSDVLREIAGTAPAAGESPPDVGAILMGHGDVETALRQLCEWGNLEAHPDTAEVQTVEEFYRPRFLYQLTVAGEAAERALAIFEKTLRQPGELKTAALGDIRVLLGELADLGDAPQPDEGKVHRALLALVQRFEDLTSQAQRFIGSLQRAIDLHGVEMEAFLAYKRNLIDYLEKFIGELTIATADIALAVERVESRGVDRLLAIAAGRDIADSLNADAVALAEHVAQWTLRWRGFKSWFVAPAGEASQAAVLRGLARRAIPNLLLAITGMNDRRAARSDRVTDLRTLARWFAECQTDDQAHQLWRAAFGLSPARHMAIDAATLDARDQTPVANSTSWLDAPPLLISPKLRATGRTTRGRHNSNIIDRTEDRRMLERLSREQAAELALAQERLASFGRARISDIGRLDRAEFDLFLEMLGQALARKTRPDETVEATSSDGMMTIRMEPTRDGRGATLHTPDGTFSGQDHFVHFVSTFSPDSPELALEEVA